MSEREVSKSESDKVGKRMQGDMRDDGKGFGKKEGLEGREEEVRMRAKKFVCGDEVVEENVFAINDER